MKKNYCLILLLSLALAGCAPAISTSLQQEAGPKVSFAELSAHPDQYAGQVEILGGQVIQVQPLGQGSLVSIDEHNLDSQFFPSGAASGGTFLVASDQPLNPNSYQPKSTITVAGVVQGQKDGLLLLKARQIHYWEGPRWEKFFQPVPPEWYDSNPAMAHWYTPPYFDIWRGGGRP